MMHHMVFMYVCFFFFAFSDISGDVVVSVALLFMLFAGKLRETRLVLK